ncbi:RagB/SusD family nutrient uptake outer membrane protein [Stigmatella aurantiaca]|uniref:Conserved uncharacterized protein n=1 Tax=Stigmatella aurantiaca (strain DW4/3-1) TaxID=378806 RepID=E3FUP1_STIAD|nr:RagB/SusD family nutrient uptake outer membrane protein [Stigmatella aurantiaca]ADO75924.1 conserved uncharacterized protein [Stigmatella aurantiaca DW4/3-1]
MRNPFLKKQVLVTLCASLTVGGCSLEVGDLNNPGLDAIRETPTPAGVFSVATGLLIGNRAGVSAQNGYVAQLGILGRESFTLDPADPRYVTEMVRGTLNPGSPAFGGSNWNAPYANIRNANTLLSMVDKVSGLTDAQKEATRGFAKTIQAIDFLVAINTRDENGAPIDVGGDITELAPIEPKAVVFTHIATLLDEAKAHLTAGGTAFPFPLSSGYDGFDTPPDFIAFNRALKARVEVYRGNFTSALTALDESFLDLAAPLELGVYHTYSTSSGDATNALFSNGNIIANPLLVTEAERKLTGDVDDRVTRKIGTLEKEVKYDDAIRSTYEFILYDSASAPIPIIRNEELILLRAEANIGLGNIPTAAEDLNFIRVTSGGLTAREDITAANALDELLRQKRYSLLFEGGHRWIDLRRYNRLETIATPDSVINRAFPLPSPETDARK